MKTSHRQVFNFPLPEIEPEEGSVKLYSDASDCSRNSEDLISMISIEEWPLRGTWINFEMSIEPCEIEENEDNHFWDSIS